MRDCTEWDAALDKGPMDFAGSVFKDLAVATHEARTVRGAHICG